MPRLSADERRAEVVTAAVVEFARRGLHGTSTEDIARRVGISQPYLFRLFPTKKALFLAAVEHTFDRSREVLLRSAHDLEGAEALEAMGKQYQEFLTDRTLLLTQLHAFAACDDEEVRAVVQRCFAKLWSDLAERSGADGDEMAAFVAKGMLLNVLAAMEAPAAIPVPWVLDHLCW